MNGISWKIGDNISTDEILPVQYMVITDPNELARHIMENIIPDFAKKFRPGDIIVAGENFGCGSSREHAPLALKGAGAGAIIARSFARIFYRNSLNIGLPVIICPAAVEGTMEGDFVSIDINKGTVANVTREATYTFTPYPAFIMEYLRNGGLIESLNQEFARSLLDLHER